LFEEFILIIYKVTNSINGKVYIVKTIRDLSKRKYAHKNVALNGKNNFKFHRAIRKYGWDNFEWAIIDIANSKEELNEKEIYWIAEYRKTHTLYNMTDGGEGVLNPSKESRLKQSLALKGRKFSTESLKKMSDAKKGKPKTEEWKNTLKENIKNNENYGMKGKKHSAESCLKMSESQKGKKQSQELIDKRIKGRKGENHPLYGIKRSEETKRKLSESQKGKIPWNKGKTNVYSEETLKKIKEARAKQVFTEESRLKMSSTMKKIWREKRL
jgi:group I intron endonuclease